VNIVLNELKKGSKGEQVKALQRMLHTMGYNIGSNNPIDGDFGPMTDAAVRAYQKKYGLIVDGLVGEQTWTKLLKG
jgi:peptidoglycan hydrolase-like protein with peptidoglycan-binding domain